MKTPISYYGGKQTMLAHILPLLPEHNTYVEPFCGGAAVFWAKNPSPIEILNDVNGNATNFYEVLQNDFEKLRRYLNVTLHSHQTYRNAMIIYENPHLFSKVRRAWAFWVACNMSYGSSPGGGWAFQKRNKNRCSLKVANSVDRLQTEYSERLRHVSIENDDALKVIRRFDSEQTFHYIDPPYYNADMGHYKGYSKNDFKELLKLLSSVKGKFLLSSYPSDLLIEFVKENGWYSKEIIKPLCMSKGKKKTEVLTANYEIR